MPTLEELQAMSVLEDWLNQPQQDFRSKMALIEQFGGELSPAAKAIIIKKALLESLKKEAPLLYQKQDNLPALQELARQLQQIIALDSDINSDQTLIEQLKIAITEPIKILFKIENAEALSINDLKLLHSTVMERSKELALLQYYLQVANHLDEYSLARLQKKINELKEYKNLEVAIRELVKKQEKVTAQPTEILPPAPARAEKTAEVTMKNPVSAPSEKVSLGRTRQTAEEQKLTAKDNLAEAKMLAELILTVGTQLDDLFFLIHQDPSHSRTQGLLKQCLKNHDAWSNFVVNFDNQKHRFQELMTLLGNINDPALIAAKEQLPKLNKEQLQTKLALLQQKRADELNISPIMPKAEKEKADHISNAVCEHIENRQLSFSDKKLEFLYRKQIHMIKKEVIQPFNHLNQLLEELTSVIISELKSSKDKDVDKKIDEIIDKLAKDTEWQNKILKITAARQTFSAAYKKIFDKSNKGVVLDIGFTLTDYNEKLVLKLENLASTNKSNKEYSAALTTLSQTLQKAHSDEGKKIVSAILEFKDKWPEQYEGIKELKIFYSYHAKEIIKAEGLDGKLIEFDKIFTPNLQQAEYTPILFYHKILQKINTDTELSVNTNQPQQPAAAEEKNRADTIEWDYETTVKKTEAKLADMKKNVDELRSIFANSANHSPLLRKFETFKQSCRPPVTNLAQLIDQFNILQEEIKNFKNTIDENKNTDQVTEYLSNFRRDYLEISRKSTEQSQEAKEKVADIKELERAINDWKTQLKKLEADVNLTSINSAAKKSFEEYLLNNYPKLLTDGQDLHSAYQFLNGLVSINNENTPTQLNEKLQSVTSTFFIENINLLAASLRSIDQYQEKLRSEAQQLQEIGIELPIVDQLFKDINHYRQLHSHLSEFYPSLLICIENAIATSADSTICKNPNDVSQILTMQKILAIEIARELHGRSKELGVNLTAGKLTQEELNSQNTKLNYYIKNDVLQHASIGGRAIALDRWVHVMELAYQQGDYHSAHSIYTALNAPELLELATSRASLSSASQRILETFPKKITEIESGAVNRADFIPLLVLVTNNKLTTTNQTRQFLADTPLSFMREAIDRVDPSHPEHLFSLAQNRKHAEASQQPNLLNDRMLALATLAEIVNKHGYSAVYVSTELADMIVKYRLSYQQTEAITAIYERANSQTLPLNDSKLQRLLSQKIPINFTNQDLHAINHVNTTMYYFNKIENPALRKIALYAYANFECCRTDKYQPTDVIINAINTATHSGITNEQLTALARDYLNYNLNDDEIQSIQQNITPELRQTASQENPPPKKPSLLGKLVPSKSVRKMSTGSILSSLESNPSPTSRKNSTVTAEKPITTASISVPTSPSAKPDNTPQPDSPSAPRRPSR